MSAALRCSMALALGACLVHAQSKKAEDLGIGKILVTTRTAGDPHFAKAVILLVRYDREGTLGLMIHRPTRLPISQALSDLKSASGRSDTVFVGGPVELETVFGLARSAEKTEGVSDVGGGISFVASKPALEKALARPANPAELRIYLGYCGWAPHQLENEMQYGLWYVFDKSQALAFDDQPATLWQRLIDKAEAQAAWLLIPGLLPAFAYRDHQ